jgi:hypothetical protein
VPDIVLQDNAKAAIAKVVEFGLKEGKSLFFALVFSLVNIIILKVSVENSITIVKRTEIIELSPPIEKYNENTNPLEGYCQRGGGFVSLIHFFNTTASRDLSKFSRGYFPTEIFTKILANTDFFTHNTYAEVSKTLRALC